MLSRYENKFFMFEPAETANLNFSQELQNALKAKLKVEWSRRTSFDFYVMKYVLLDNNNLTNAEIA